jgi:isoleucyl-tRNA synthetase
VREAARDTAALIREELNVKSIETSVDEAAFCSLTVKPNFATLKTRAASKLKEIGQGLSGWGFGEVGKLEGGEAIELAGERITLEDVLLQRKPTPGRAVASEGDVTVVLDTELTPELLAEGVAREFVSVLQQARKNQGLEVSDRVKVAYDAPDSEVLAAIDKHASTIAEEVLALDFRRDTSTPVERASTESLNGRPVRFTLEKV